MKTQRINKDHLLIIIIMFFFAKAQAQGTMDLEGTPHPKQCIPPTPSGLFADSVTKSSAKLHATLPVSYAFFGFAYKSVNDTKWVTTSLGNPQWIYNLSPGTTYEYYAITYCNPLVGQGTRRSTSTYFTTLKMGSSTASVSPLAYNAQNNKIHSFIPSSPIIQIPKADMNGLVSVQKKYSGEQNHFDQHSNRELSKEVTMCIKKQQTLGGSGDEFTGLNGFAKVHNGYVTCGETSSNDGDFHVPLQNGFEGYLVKYDLSGKIVWAYTYGGSGEDAINSIIPTIDGGFIGVGYTASNDGDVKGNHGGYDIWIIKFNGSGKIQWQKCFGGTDDDYSIGNILENPDGTYVISGSAGSSDGDISFNHGGGSDFWIAQISSHGHIIWQHSYGGSGFDDNTGLVKVNDGYISSGITTSNDGDVTGNHGAQDAWVIKFDESGKLIWSKSFGGSGDEFDNAMTKTTDGNIVLGCVTLSNNDGDVSGSQYGDDMWLVKVNVHTGKIIWQKCYGTRSYGDGAFGIFPTNDGGVVGVGAMGTIPYYQPGHNVFVLKAGVNGDQQWSAIFGGSDGEEAYGGMETSEGKFIIICQTSSLDGDVKNNHGGFDTWFLTLDKCGHYVGVDEALNNSIISSEKVTLQSAPLKAAPNPFSNSTTITFSLAQSQKISIQIFDMNGRLIKTLANSQMQPGAHQLTWNATNEKGNSVSTGIYFLRKEAGNYIETKILSVIK